LSLRRRDRTIALRHFWNTFSQVITWSEDGTSSIDFSHVPLTLFVPG
jgi:hypothetical protein